MAGNKRSDDKVEVAHISGFAALAAQARAHRAVIDGQDGEEAAGEESAALDDDAPDIFATVTEHAPMPQKTCAVCAARNDADRDSCWNCGASLARRR